jgi:beta-galactosidase
MKGFPAVCIITLALIGFCARGSAAANPSRTEILFDEGWKFCLGDSPGAQAPDFDDRGWRSLNLPHDWSIELPFDARLASGTGYLPGGIGWYRKSFALPARAAGRRVSLRFDGVYCNSEVWINGRSLGRRPNGYVSFEYNLTPFLALDAKGNVVAVRVDHTKYADSRWYTGSGIYRHVWLKITGRIFIEPWGTFVTTPQITGPSAALSIQIQVNNDTAQAQDAALISIVRNSAGRTVATTETRHSFKPGERFLFEQSARLANPALWSPASPNLYSVASRLQIGKSMVDEVETPFGIRSAAFDPEKGFILNGAQTVFKGVCIHHDAGALGGAVPDRALERRLQLMKELGCNAIRTSHNPPAPELLDLCDRMGFLVMDEAFDEWAKPKKKWIEGWNVGKPGLDGYAEYFDEWAIRDIQSMVERDKNHPSVILWSIGNEIDYDRDPYYDPESKGYTPDKPSAADLPAIAARLIKAVKEIDTTRPVTAGLANITVSNRLGLADLLDVVGYNYLEKYYQADHARYPARKILGSENSHALSAWETVRNLAYVGGQFLWTGIDYLGEARQWPARSSSAGLLDECGFRKPAFYFRQSLWSEKPMVYLSAGVSGRPGGERAPRPEMVPHWNWQVKDGDPVNVIAYTNCEKVELFLNGKSMGEKSLSAAQDRVLSWEVPYAAGTVLAVGKKGASAAASRELKTAGKPERIRLDPDITSIAADGRDLAHVEVSLVDSAGNFVFTADSQVSFEISGNGRILAVDSGDIRSHESFQTASRKAYQGRCLVIVQSTSEPGPILLKATSPGMREGTVTIQTRRR